MARYAGQLFKRAASLANPGPRPIRMRVGALAMSSGCMRLRNITVAGTGDGSPWAAWAPSTAYTKGDIRTNGGQQWVCHTSHAGQPSFTGTTHWRELRPLPYFAALWAQLTPSSTGQSIASVVGAMRAANPGCRLYQYVTIDTIRYDTEQANLNLYSWLNTNGGWLFSDNGGALITASKTCTRQASPANVVLCADTSGLAVGMAIVGTGIPAGACIGSITANTSFTLVATSQAGGGSINATAAGTSTLTFSNRIDTNQVYIGNNGQAVVNFARASIVDSSGKTFARYSAEQRVAQFAGYMPDGWACDNSLSLLGENTAGGPPNWADNGADYVGNGTTFHTDTNFWGTGYWRSGNNETCQDSDVKPLLHAGLALFWDELRRAAPGTRLMANGGIKQPDAWRGTYDALLFEGWGKFYSNEQTAANGWLQVLLNVYRVINQFSRSRTLPALMNCATFDDPPPAATITTQPFHKDIRYWLSTCLLTDAMFCWTSDDVEGGASNSEGAYRAWIAEYDVPLGTPTEAAPTAAWSNGVWKREYENGLVLVHPRLTLTGNWEAEANRSVTLPFDCRRLTGTLDPADDGSLLLAGSTVSLPVRTGLILLRA